MGEIDFIQRDWLLALIGLPVLYWLLMRLMRLREERLRLLGSAAASVKTGVYLPIFFFLCALLALSRPYFGYEDIQVPRVGRDLMLVVDVSLSMAARDNSPTRMDFAKRKIRDTIEYISKNSTGDRLGIVLFAGESYLYCPLTADYAVLKTFTNSISVGLVSSGGSAITQAVITAANSFSNTKALKPGIILISDGEDNEMVVKRSLEVLKGYQLKLWALGVGTPEGKPIELRDGILLKDSKSQIVVTKLNEAALRQLAEGSGAMYRRATFDDSDIRAIFADISQKIEIAAARDDETKVRIYHEYGPALLWIPLFIISVAALAARRELVFSFLCLIIGSAADVSALEPTPAPPAGEVQTEILSPYDAQSAYASGDFEAARRAFAHYHKLDPADPKILHALASTEYRLNNFKQASKLFSELAEQAQSGRERFGALYDKGTADINAKEYRGAVDALEKALAIKPNDEAAMHNLGLAKKLIEEQEKKEQEKKDRDKDKKQEDKKNEKKEEKKEDSEQKSKSEEEKKEQADKDQSQQQDKDKQGEQQDEQSDQQKAEEQQKENDKEKEGKQQKGEEKDGQPSTTPTPDSQGSGPGQTPVPATPQSEQDKDQPDNSSDKPSEEQTADKQSSGGSQKQYDAKALKEREAQAWLESLDDSPVLLRRQVGNKRSNQQQSW